MLELELGWGSLSRLWAVLLGQVELKIDLILDLGHLVSLATFSFVVVVDCLEYFFFYRLWYFSMISFCRYLPVGFSKRW